MATIELYANKINRIPGLVTGIRNETSNLKSELMTLKTKVQSINQNICNVDDVMASISASTQTQGDKIDALNKLEDNVLQFTLEAEKADSEVAEAVKQNKNNFYEEYSYLKPFWEKNLFEQMADVGGFLLDSAAEWCQEHWVEIVTVLVVIAIAVVAVVTFGVTIPAIATIAGIVSLTLGTADIICMFATGGKSISDLCHENGIGWLGDIFDGLSNGADLVSIVFPFVAGIKRLAKVGLKTFVKSTIQSAKHEFKDMTKQIFKSGFKDGVKNFGKITFKTFIFDIDDISRVNSSGKRVFDIFEHEPSITISKINEKTKPILKTGETAYWKPGDNLIYPPNDGFSGETFEATIHPGTIIDGYGDFSNDFAAPKGTPYKERDLPAGSDKESYNVFEVIEDIDVIGGKAGSWFGKNQGGGERYKFSSSIEDLLKEGKLKIIDYPQIVINGLVGYFAWEGIENLVSQ